MPTIPRRILCAHADQDGEGAHWKEPGETCPLTVVRLEVVAGK